MTKINKEKDNFFFRSRQIAVYWRVSESLMMMTIPEDIGYTLLLRRENKKKRKENMD
jgi:hypothetical protein